MLSDSKVMKGEGRAVICAVGDHTLLSRHRKNEHLVIKEEETELEEKLGRIAKNVESYALDAMFAIFIT